MQAALASFEAALTAGDLLQANTAVWHFANTAEQDGPGLQEAAWGAMRLVPAAAERLREWAEAALMASRSPAAGEPHGDSSPAAAAAAPPQQQQQQRQMDSCLVFCGGWALAVDLASQIDSAQSTAQVAAWCQAAQSSLQLLPLLTELQQVAAAQAHNTQPAPLNVPAISSLPSPSADPPPSAVGSPGPMSGLPAQVPATQQPCPVAALPLPVAVGAPSFQSLCVQQLHQATGLLWHCGGNVCVAVMEHLGDQLRTGQMRARFQAAMAPHGDVRQAMAAAEQQWRPPATAAEVAALAQPLYELHDTSCRLAHWVAGLGSQQQQEQVLADLALSWPDLLTCSANAYHMLLQPLARFAVPVRSDRVCATEVPEAEARRLLLRASAAQLEVALVAGAHMSAQQLSAACHGSTRVGLHTFKQLCHALAEAPAGRVTEEVAHIMHSMLQQSSPGPQHGDSDNRELCSLNAVEAVRALKASPRATAAFLGCGSLPLLQRIFAPARGMFSEFEATVLAAVTGVIDLAISLAPPPPAGMAAVPPGLLLPTAVPAGLPPNQFTHFMRHVSLAVRYQAVKDELEELDMNSSDPPIEEERTQMLLPLAIEASALLQEHWAVVEQVAAAQLQAGQAAAARVCANLRCPSLGVAGSKRCGGCRVARYCSTECSQADWRRGHRLVCRRLGELRQEQAAPAQEQAAAGHGLAE